MVNGTLILLLVYLIITGGRELLGSQDNEILDIIIQKTIQETEGVKRVLTFNPSWSASTRDYRYYVLIELDDDTQFSLAYQPQGAITWQAA